MSLTGKTNEERIWNFLKGKGLTDCGVAGLMGNLYAESGLRPNNLQNSYEKKLGYTDESYTAAVDSGEYTNFAKDSAGYGLAQWTYHTRKAALLAFVQACSASIGDLEAQLNFLWKELSEGGYKSTLAVLKAATTIKEASDKVLTQYERPADMSDAVKTKRAGYGQTYYDKYADRTSSSATTEKEETGMECTASKVLAIAVAEIGYKEKENNSQLDTPSANAGDGNYTKYARDFDQKYPEWYNGKKNGFAWCDMFVDWCFLTAFGYEKALELLCQPERSAGAGCTYSARYYRNKNQFYTSDPKPGDQIFFGSSIDDCSHTGIVEKVDGSKVYTIEGNTSNQVARRSYTLTSSKIVGYGRPKYDAETASAPVAPTPSEPETKALKVGDIVTFTGTTHYTSANAAKGPACKPGKAKVTAIYKPGVSKHPYHLVRVSGGGSTVYGWVDAEDIAEVENFEPDETWTPAVGDVVIYNGSVHYKSANASTSYACKGGKAKVTAIYQPGKSKHPYHLVRISGGGSTVYGWVDAGSFKKA